MAILAGAGPMGLGAIDYAIHCDRKPGMLVVTDIDQARLDRAASIYTVEDAAANGVKLVYLNTSGEDPVGKLMALTDDKGYNDVLVFAPVAPVIEQGDKILAFNGCLNFFAGPTNPSAVRHVQLLQRALRRARIWWAPPAATPSDMIEALDMIAAGTPAIPPA